MTDVVARLTAALGGRYRPEREVGAGGMAMVYLATEVRHERQVALKLARLTILGLDAIYLLGYGHHR